MLIIMSDQEDPEPIEPEPVETEQDSLQKPAKKKKGRPALSDKQKAALQAGREKSRKNMALAMTKAKLARLQEEEKPEPTEDDDDHVEHVKP